ncbi:putative zinc-ribbon domain, plant, protein enhanced disease resistance 4 [Dioscorea sansibarensis]
MASYATKYRYVKCPKCLKLLMEFAHIPLYKCGGCGKVLQSKLYNVNEGNVISGSVDANQAHTIPSNESSNDVPMRSVNQLVPSSSNAESSEVEERRVEEKIIVSNLKSTSTKAEQNIQKDDSEYVGQNHSMRNDTSPDSSLDEELEKPLKPGKQGSDSPSVSSEQNKAGKAAVHDELTGGSRSPSARSYQTYDDSVSSSDDGHSDRVRNRHSSLSRRTRHRIVLDSADEEEKTDALATNVTTYKDQRFLYSSDIEGREGADVLAANGMTNDAEENLEVISRRAYRRRRILLSANAKGKEQENAIESDDMGSGSEEHLQGGYAIHSNAIASTLDEHHKVDNARGVNGMSSTFDGHHRGDTVVGANGMSSLFDEHCEGDNSIGANGMNRILDEQHKGNNVIGANGMSSTSPEHRDDGDSFIGANGMISTFDERRNGNNIIGTNYMSSTFHEHHEGDSLLGASDMISTLDEHHKGDDVIGANGMTSTFDVHHKRGMSSSSEGHLEGKRLASNSLKDGHDSAIDGTSDSNVDELSSEIRTHGQGWRSSIDSDEFYSVRNWLESENGGPSRSTSRGSNFYPDSLQYQNGISGIKLKSVKNEREELQRKVSELRNQLSGLYDQKMKHSAQLSSNARSQLMMHPNYSGHQACYMPQQCHFSRISFSDQSCSSCLHCLPPQSCCHSGPYYSSSHSMSSQSSEAPCYHKPQRGDGYESEKTHGKDKKPRAKRHCLPMLGGAPFVVCTNCSRLLQLPADILISGSKQKLQCGDCSEVFVFLFSSRAYTDPLTSAEALHPPSEFDNKDDDPQGDPISFTEEYDLSLDNSCSTEIEIVQNTDRKSTGSDKQRAAVPLHTLMGYHSARELLKTRFFEQPMQDVYGNLQERHRGKGASILNRHSADETSPSFMQKYEEDQSPKKFKTGKVGAPLQGIVKRGVRELNHGLESLKIKVHASRRTAPAPQNNKLQTDGNWH